MKKLLLISLIAILIPLMLFGFLGCMKVPENKANYGPETTFEEIRKASGNDAPTDPFSIWKGQYVSIDTSYVIETQIPTLVSQRLDEVTDYAEDTNKVYMQFDVTLVELNDGAWKQSKLEPLVLSLKKTETQRLKQLAMKAMANDGAKVTYHNLKKETGILPVPEIVRKKPNCGGVPGCKLRYVQLSFDQVKWDSPDHGIKTSVKFIYSPDIPTYIADYDDMGSWGDYGVPLTNELQACFQTWLELSNNGQTQVVPYLQCREVRDFQFGTKEPATDAVHKHKKTALQVAKSIKNSSSTKKIALSKQQKPKPSSLQRWARQQLTCKNSTDCISFGLTKSSDLHQKLSPLRDKPKLSRSKEAYPLIRDF